MTTYVYAITDAAHPLRLSGVTGVGDPAAPLRAVRTEDLCAVVSDAPAELRAKRRMWRPTRTSRNDCSPRAAVCRCASGWSGRTTTRSPPSWRSSTTPTPDVSESWRAAGSTTSRSRATRTICCGRSCGSPPRCSRLNDRTRRHPDAYDAKLALGELISQEVWARHVRVRTDILSRLAPSAVRIADSEPAEQHFLTTSFLVARDQAAVFSQAVHTEAERRGTPYAFRLYGPMPPYSFV